MSIKTIKKSPNNGAGMSRHDKRRLVKEAELQAALMHSVRSVLATQGVHTVSHDDLAKLAKVVQGQVFARGFMMVPIEALVTAHTIESIEMESHELKAGGSC